MLVATGKLEQHEDGSLTATGDLAELAELAVPETLKALIASRLDALEPADRALAWTRPCSARASRSAASRPCPADAEQELATRMRTSSVASC